MGGVVKSEERGRGDSSKKVEIIQRRRVYERRAVAVFSRGGKEDRVDKRESARKRQCGVPCVNIHPTGVSACASGNHRRLNHRRCRCRRRRRKSSRSYESTWSTRFLATRREEETFNS